jgi:hypothetical protein
MAGPKGVGLTKWFDQKWVNIGAPKKNGKWQKCGTSGKGGGYAKCVPPLKLTLCLSLKGKAQFKGKGLVEHLQKVKRVKSPRTFLLIEEEKEKD